MELNLEMKQQLEKLLAKPALVTEEHLPLLQNLVKVYPYYQPLYLLLAKAGFSTENQSSFLATAALYNNGNVLHQIIHEPHKVTPLRDVQVIEYKPWSITHHVEIENAIISDDVLKGEQNEIEHLNNQEHPAINTQPDQFFEEITTEEIENIATELEVIPEPLESFADQTEATEAPEIENLEPLANEVIHCSSEGNSEEEVLEPATNSEQLASEAQQTLTTNEEPLPIVEQAPVVETNTTFVLPEIENLAPLANELLKIGIVSDPIELEHQSNDVVQPLTTEQEIVKEDADEETEKENIVEDPAISAQPEKNIEDLTIESIAASDFFAFETNFTSEKVEDENPIIGQKTDTNTHSANKYEYSDTIISKYDDDKLPFSFLWWLSKTRKNHEQIFRPFVSPAKLTSPTAALQQQYVENIFHLQTSFSENTEEESYNGPPKVLSKENELVENFIKNDPQIKVPKPDQINNDNKAKKSAEDNYDVVSETLAQIYIEQVLYHKAIDTYQKLSLKFPEKSRYFADLILSLEKKI